MGHHFLFKKRLAKSPSKKSTCGTQSNISGESPGTLRIKPKYVEKCKTSLIEMENQLTGAAVGKEKVKMLPLPGEDEILIRPPWDSTSVFEMYRPRPTPLRSLLFS